jgi:hypothetical protein
MEPSEILEGMIEILQEKDWIQKKMYLASEGLIKAVCIEGACNLTLRDDCLQAMSVNDFFTMKDSVSKAVLRVVADLFPERKGPAMFDFNDHPATTKEDVLLVLKTALGNETR